MSNDNNDNKRGDFFSRFGNLGFNYMSPESSQNLKTIAEIIGLFL